MNNRTFTYQNISFSYRLVLEERKTLAVSVLPSQAVIVKAPLGASDERIDDFLRRKFRWVLKQQRYFAQFRACPEKRYVSGETFRYRGRSHKLLIQETVHHEHVSLQQGTLTVFTTLPTESSHNRILLDVWYRERAHRVFPERLGVCFDLFGFDGMPGLMIKPMTRRWGSYSNKTNRVILNQELIKAATRHVDYVIVHELCHMRYKLHSRGFYELLASRLPQWRRLKAELEISLLG